MTTVVRGRRCGAPKKDPKKAKSRVVTVRLTPGEYDRITQDAEQAGKAKAVGRYLADRALSRQPRVIPAINRAAHSYLGHWRGAFTTMAQDAARGELHKTLQIMDPPLSLQLAEVREVLEDLRAALLGHDRRIWAERDRQAASRTRRDGRGRFAETLRTREAAEAQDDNDDEDETSEMEDPL